MDMALGSNVNVKYILGSVLWLVIKTSLVFSDSGASYFVQ